MPQLSIKASEMPESPIRKLVPFADKAERDGKKVYYLNIGQPDIKTPEVALEAVKNIDMEVVEYSKSAGNDSYREGLAKYYQNLGLEVEAQNILITTGGSEALLFGFMSCFNPGDEVIISEPFYANYNGFAMAAGVNVVPLRAEIENGFALPSIEEFEAKITNRTKGILICNPGNPTGYLYSKPELERLIDIVKKHDLFLFADEVYREFCYDGYEHTSILSYPEIAENAVVVDSVSKRYSMCGARIGAFVTKNKNLIQTALKFAQARLSPPSFGQIAGEAALQTPASYFKEVIQEYDLRRNILVNGLREIPGVICPSPNGAFYTMVQLPVDDAEKFCQWMLEDFEHDGATVMMAPGNGFYSFPESGKQQARIAYVLKKEDLEKAIECIKAGLEKYPGRVEK